MPEISLRAYTKEIDELIEREKLDEAIAHCRHVLQIYPKHLECYRLLGKAYLEAKRYGDAADIFQRVLSAIPDDFVAHIGMSIVREDEGNLDSAIWHMERAFETNPANPAIQQEMRRLIGRRDGLEPHKVRLTRGALARMYAHGELYPQAIAELRSALQEDAERPDLQVLLSEMYWRTNRQDEAASVCQRILDKLPFCLEANRILATLLHNRGRVDDSAPYRRRMASLDPYTAFLDSPMADPQSIDAGSVQLDRLQWQPGQPLPAIDHAQPDWAASLGVDLKEEAEEPTEEAEGTIPSWLDALEPGSAPVLDEPPEPSAAYDVDEPEVEGEIPEWMREAGWAEGSGEAVETPVSFSDAELDSLDAGQLPADTPEPTQEDLAPAAIPSWLQGMAPPDEETAPELPPAESTEEGEGGLPDWLQGLGGAPPDQEAASGVGGTEFDEPEWSLEGADEESIEAPGAAMEPEAEGDLPNWLEEAPGATETIVSWLSDKEGAEAEELEGGPGSISGMGEFPELEDEALQDETTGPDWLATPETEEAEASLPEWLSEGSEEAEAAAPDWLLEERVEDEATSPDWLTEGEAQPSEAPQGDRPGWLDGVAEAARQDRDREPEPATDETDETAGEPELVEAQVPGWLQTIAGDGQVGEDGEDEGLATADQAVSDDDADIASWQEEAGFELEGGVTPLPEDLGATGWLRDIASAAPPLEAEATAEPEEPVESEAALDAPEPSMLPDWLDEIRSEAVHGMEAAEAYEEQAEVEEPPAPQEPAAETVLSEISPEEEAGGQPEISSMETVVSPRSDALAEAGEALLRAQEEPAAEPSIELSGELDDDAVFRWLEGLAARQGADEGELVTRPEDRLSDLPDSIDLGDEGPILQEREYPEEAAESLEWLDRLASERGLNMEITLNTGPTPASAPAEEAEGEDLALEAGTRWAPETDEPSLARAPEQTDKQSPETMEWLNKLATGELAAEEAEEVPAAESAVETPPADVEPAIPDVAMEAAEVEDQPLPLEAAEVPAQVPEAEEGDTVEWLTQLAEHPTEVPAAPTSEFAPPRHPVEGEEHETIEWLNQLADEAPATEPAPIEPSPDMPAAVEAPVAEPSMEPAPEPQVPDWLRMMTEEASELTAEQPMSPAEGADLPEAEEWQIEEAWPAEAEAPESPAAGLELEPETAPEPQPGAVQQPDLQEPTPSETPDWLRSLAEEEAMDTEPEFSVPQAPDWLQAEESPAETVLREETPEPVEEPAEPQVPDWLQAEPPPAETVLYEEAPEPVEEPAEPQARAPDWLQAEPPPAETVLYEEAPEPVEEPAEPQAQAPDWLQAEPPPAETVLYEETPEPVEEPAEPQAQAPDWPRAEPPPAESVLREEAPEPVEEPAEPQAQAPDWLRAEPPPAETVLYEEAPEPVEEPAEPQAQAPDWLQAEPPPAETVLREEAPEPVEEPAEPQAQTPDWLQAEPPPAETVLHEEAPQPVEEPAEPQAQTPDWLQAEPPPAETVLHEEALEPVKEPAEPRPVDTAQPPWLRQSEEPAPKEVTAEDFAVPDWLKAAGQADVPEPGPPVTISPTPELREESVPNEAISPPAAPPAEEPAGQVATVRPEPEPPSQQPPAPEPQQVPSPEPVPAQAQAEPPPAKKGKPEPDELLAIAREALAQSRVGDATKNYGVLIKRRFSLDVVIEDLRLALDRTPREPQLWQMLGDAYMKNDQLSEAIEAYRRGMEAA